ncbi:MAG: phosphoribosylamine--glycine ligase [Candidatus Daviesbacteria bacterium]|nr:phosphoribosylamine--glycine ligase [Candidatus Daviesbacteria bacterium]
MERNLKTLVIGSGGREDALAWKISQSPLLDRLYITPGNPGTRRWGESVAVKSDDIDGIVDFIRSNKINLTVIGPEATLAAGLADQIRLLEDPNIRVYGPNRREARIETSKAWAIWLMQSAGIPYPITQIFTEPELAFKFLKENEGPFVYKANGLTSGKGVIVTETKEEGEEAIHRILVNKEFDSGDILLIQEKLSGQEVSVMGISDGETIKIIPPAVDHKRLLDQNRGPNTGGMGAYSVNDLYSQRFLEWTQNQVLQKAVDYIRKNYPPYIGTLYAGLMITPKGVKVLEFNARFGDPETQTQLPRLEGDFLQMLWSAAEGKLDKSQFKFSPKAAVTTILTTPGYPEKPRTGQIIYGLDTVTDPDVLVFHAGTTQNPDGSTVTSGGRVLAISAIGDTLIAARKKAYSQIGPNRIHFDKMHYRTDIAPQTT